MASICTSNFHFLCRKNNPSPISHHLLLSPSSLSFSRCGGLRLCRCAAVKTGSEGGGIRSDNAELLRKPVISTEVGDDVRKYAIGDRLSPDHQRTILQRLLPYHPECDKKIGPGVDYITVGYHPDFENSRCLFIVRKDGESVDFSYWKCIKGLIRKNYPLYADSFILRHFRKRRRND
ncbi:hypothetical protein H5410_024362 [Solanum commersonii]|uniref:DCL protein n=1 Tax=Solanum commersonii TaxID=4109 RepID=A0A9J5ZLR1_SOLCO|nr:hypothetical protein H5410_024362 [Solanum commersonii]